MQRLRRTLALLVVFGGLSGCESIVGADHFAGTFALVRIGESSLPALTPSTPDTWAGVATSVIADTLVLRSDGRGTWRTVWRRRELSGGTDEVVRIEMPVEFSRRGDLVTVAFLQCGARCTVAFRESAALTADGGLQRARYPNPWQYERVSDAAVR